jgi:catechol O-methyltransferase
MGTNEDEDKDESDDPFACFDSSDDDEDDDDAGQAETATFRQQIQNEEEQSRRDPGNGVLAFHAGTEVALLHHVKTQLQLAAVKAAPATDVDTDVAGTMIRNAQTVLDLVDSYCMSRHWMMHVGPEKATPLRRFIGDCLVKKGKTTNDGPSTGDGSSAFTFVELGTYCGYSSIFFAKTVLEHYWNDSNTTTTTTTATDDTFSFHIYSVEVVEKFAAVAKELIRLAGMEAYITVILMKDPDAITAATRRGEEEGSSSLSSELKSRLPICNDRAEDASSTTTIDVLFVDHDKSLYLPNLRELEDAGMIRKGTHVAADNVVFAEIHDYRHYMADLADKGIVATRLEDSLMVEYCQPELIQQESGSETMAGGEASENNKDENNASTTATITKDMLRDGIEFSVYLRDPR